VGTPGVPPSRGVQRATPWRGCAPRRW
jgi:hypothetical protein